MNEETPLVDEGQIVNCQSCGKQVTVPIDFVGCAFCSDCIENDSPWSADAREFKQTK